MKNSRTVVMTFVCLNLVILSCGKEQGERVSDSNIGNEAMKAAAVYSPLGNASIERMTNGDISVFNLSSSGRDGFRIDMSDFCNADFEMDEIHLNGQDDFFCVASIDAKGRLLARIGVEHSTEGNELVFELGNQVENAEIQLWLGDTMLYFERLEAKSGHLESKAFPWWPLLRWLIMNSIKDFHTSTSLDVDLENNTATNTTVTTISWASIANPDDGGFVQLPHETFFADRVSIKVSGHEYPMDFIEVNSAGIGTILLTRIEFGTDGCK